MNILILGSGGREHALAWRLAQDDFSEEEIEKVYVAPGNPGMALDSKIEVIDEKMDDVEAIKSICARIWPSLVVIGPEGPLTSGIVDELEKENLLVYGPSKKAALLEGSKIFSKQFMDKYSIPTAPYKVYSSYQEALYGLKEWNIEAGIAIKSDSLAGGKGVVVTDDLLTAKKALYDFMENPDCTVKSKKILIEKKLSGKEFSMFALCSGSSFLSIGGACDYKRVYDGDKGPNTGGMGCYIPADWPGEKVCNFVKENVFSRVLEGMQAEGTPYRGTLFAGLMIDGDQVNVVEFNVRFGDPETQTLLPVLEGNLTQTLINCASGNDEMLKKSSLKCSDKSAVHVVLASEGYPSIGKEPLDTGHPISCKGSWMDHSLQSQKVFFAGVKKNDEGLVNSGGRVLGVTGFGDDVFEARDKAYKMLENISFSGAHLRRDIGQN